MNSKAILQIELEDFDSSHAAHTSRKALSNRLAFLFTMHLYQDQVVTFQEQ